MQMMFDFSETIIVPNCDTELEVGKCLSDDEIITRVGRELKFQDLEQMVGKKVIQKDSSYLTTYKVVKINRYLHDTSSVYKKVKELPKEHQNIYGEFVNDYIYSVCMPEKYRDSFEFDYTCDDVVYSDSPYRPDKGECGVSEMYCSCGRYAPIHDWDISFYEII